MLVGMGQWMGELCWWVRRRVSPIHWWWPHHHFPYLYPFPLFLPSISMLNSFKVCLLGSLSHSFILPNTLCILSLSPPSNASSISSVQQRIIKVHTCFNVICEQGVSYSYASSVKMGLRTLKTDVVSAIDDVYNNINGRNHALHNFSMDRGCSVHVTNQNRVVPECSESTSTRQNWKIVHSLLIKIHTHYLRKVYTTALTLDLRTNHLLKRGFNPTFNDIVSIYIVMASLLV